MIAELGWRVGMPRRMNKQTRKEFQLVPSTRRNEKHLVCQPIGTQAPRHLWTFLKKSPFPDFRYKFEFGSRVSKYHGIPLPKAIYILTTRNAVHYESETANPSSLRTSRESAIKAPAKTLGSRVPTPFQKSHPNANVKLMPNQLPFSTQAAATATPCNELSTAATSSIPAPACGPPCLRTISSMCRWQLRW